MTVPVLNNHRAARDERGKVLMADRRRHQIGRQTDRYDAEAEGNPRGTLRPVTRHTHLHAHANTHATLQEHHDTHRPIDTLSSAISAAAAQMRHVFK